METALNIVIRKGLFLPHTLALAIGITLFTSVFSPGGRLAELGLSYRLAVNTFNLMLYFGASYAFLGTFLAWGLKRYYPWVLIQIPFYLPLAMMTGLLDAYASAGDLVWRDAMWSMLTSMGMVVIAVLLTVFALRPQLDAILVKLDRPGCLFGFGKPPDNPLELELPADIRAPILAMKAANQYVDVTTEKGSALVRTPLKDAIARVVASSGIQTSRSNWIAFAHIERVVQTNGKFEVHGKNGDVFNVGNTYENKVRDVLTQRGFS